MPLGEAADVFTKLSVGDGLVSQIPALIVSLAAGLLVSKGGTRGSAEQAVLGQLGNYPRALCRRRAADVRARRCMPGLPLLPFALLGGMMAFVALLDPAPGRGGEGPGAGASATRRRQRTQARSQGFGQGVAEDRRRSSSASASSWRRSCSARTANSPIASARCARKFATQYGFVVPEIKLTDDLVDRPKGLPDQDPRHGRGAARAARRRSRWSSSATVASPTCRARRRASRPSA